MLQSSWSIQLAGSLPGTFSTSLATPDPLLVLCFHATPKSNHFDHAEMGVKKTLKVLVSKAWAILPIPLPHPPAILGVASWRFLPHRLLLQLTVSLPQAAGNTSKGRKSSPLKDEELRTQLERDRPEVMTSLPGLARKLTEE